MDTNSKPLAPQTSQPIPPPQPQAQALPPPASPDEEEEEEQSTPTEVSFAALLSAFQDSTSFVISLSAFGAALFSAVISNIKDPADLVQPAGPPPRFSLQTVRVFLALGWLAFALCLAVVGFSLTFLKVLLGRNGDAVKDGNRGRDESARSGRRDPRLWHAVGVVVWAVLYGLITLAFVLLSLVLVAYVGAVGWVALGFACLVGILSVVWVVLEASRIRNVKNEAENGSAGHAPGSY